MISPATWFELESRKDPRGVDELTAAAQAELAIGWLEQAMQRRAMTDADRSRVARALARAARSLDASVYWTLDATL